MNLVRIIGVIGAITMTAVMGYASLLAELGLFIIASMFLVVFLMVVFDR